MSRWARSTLRIKSLRQQGLSYKQIADKLGCSKRIVQKAISRLINAGEVTRFASLRYTINERFFQEWTPELAYFLGFFASDGSLWKGPHGIYQTSIELRDGDCEKKVLLRLAQCVGTSRLYRRNGKSPLVSLKIFRKAVYEQMTKFGFTPNKTASLRFPNVPDDLLHHFVRGFFDGDGWVYQPRSHVYFRLRAGFGGASLAFLQTLRDTLTDLVGLTRLKIQSKRRGGKPFYSFTYSYIDSVKLYHFMYTEANGLFLKRKEAVFQHAVLLPKALEAIPSLQGAARQTIQRIVSQVSPSLRSPYRQASGA